MPRGATRRIPACLPVWRRNDEVMGEEEIGNPSFALYIKKAATLPVSVAAFFEPVREDLHFRRDIDWQDALCRVFYANKERKSKKRIFTHFLPVKCL